MSYAFDIQQRAWSRFSREAKMDEWPAHLFADLIAEMHSANHRGNDVINRDPLVGKAARRLEEWLDEAEERADQLQDQARRDAEREAGWTG